MKSEEKAQLVNMVRCEGATRHLWSIETDEEAKHKHKVTIEVREGVEEMQQSYFPLPPTSEAVDARLFAPGTLTLETVSRGYKASPDYLWLRERGSLEAKYKVQTVVSEHEDVVKLRTDKILRDHGIEPEAKRQNKMTD